LKKILNFIGLVNVNSILPDHRRVTLFTAGSIDIMEKLLIMNSIPEDIIEYIISFLWRCSWCDDIIDMNVNRCFDKRMVCNNCEDRKMLWDLRRRLISLGMVDPYRICKE